MLVSPNFCGLGFEVDSTVEGLLFAVGLWKIWPSCHLFCDTVNSGASFKFNQNRVSQVW